MGDSKASAILAGGAVMGIIGLVDSSMEQDIVGNNARAGWKILLGVAGLYINITQFADAEHKYGNKNHLSVYLASLVAVAGYALAKTSK